ncbi:lysophospholipase [Erysipelothrix sp. Poltava]|nr:lysophospholipase [Erysipelothrix sp. Poltava]
MREFLIKAPEFVAKNVSRYRYPVLICHGESDKVVPIEVGEWLYENISSKNKHFIAYPGLYHEILNETMYPEILDTMVEWMFLQLSK